MKKIFFMLALLSLFSCDLLDSVSDHLRVLDSKFEFDKVDIGFIYPPLFISTNRGDYGVSLECFLTATNPNEGKAVFDGADFSLRVNKIQDIDVASVVHVNPFTIRGNSDTTITVTIPLMLDQPVFSYEVFKKIVQGDKIPYRITAKLYFNLFEDSDTQFASSLGSGSMTIDLVTDSLSISDVAPQFLKILNLLSW